jgi:hypothetical protein
LAKSRRSGLEPEPRRREELAGAAEAGDDLVDHEEDVVFAADALDVLEVAVGRVDHAARADDRLAEERGYAIGAKLADELLERAPVVVVGRSCRRSPRSPTGSREDRGAGGPSRPRRRRPRRAR